MTTVSTQHATPRTIDAARWPDVAAAPGPSVRAQVARALFSAGVAKLPLLVRFPDGKVIGGGAPAAPVMVLNRPGTSSAASAPPA